MASVPVIIDVFCEDFGHENLIVPLVRRACAERALTVRIDTVTARGGPARIWRELEVYLVAVDKAIRPQPAILVLGLDSNCMGAIAKRRQALEKLPPWLRARAVVACPNAHVEQWYLIDQNAVTSIIGSARRAIPDKCERGVYKELLRETVRSSGQVPLRDGLEYGPDLVAQMDLFTAARTDSAFGQFWDDLRQSLMTLTPS